MVNWADWICAYISSSFAEMSCMNVCVLGCMFLNENGVL